MYECNCYALIPFIVLYRARHPSTPPLRGAPSQWSNSFSTTTPTRGRGTAPQGALPSRSRPTSGSDQWYSYHYHYNRARPTLLIKERRQHSYDTYDYDSTVFHNEGFTTPCIMDFSLTMIPVLNGPRAENHDTNFRENPALAPTGRYH